MQKLCCVRTRQQFSVSLDYFVTSSPPYLHQFSTIFGGNCINNGALLGVSQPNPNIEPTTTHTTQTTTQATDGAQGNDNVPLEIVEMLESNLSGVDSDNAALICNMVPGMVDDDNQPLPENIPSPTDEAPNAPQFFSNWEHSGNCYRCLEGGRRSKARLSFNSEVKPTIEQIFEMFF